jgi:ABC-type transport system involved in cytochrome c biogenesis ATPase subunit
MLERIQLRSFGPLRALDWQDLGPLNLVIGGNGAGKTFLLKAIYSGLRTIEEYRRGDDTRTAADILLDKLHWTFELERVGDLVTKGSDEILRCVLALDGREFRYEFGRDTARHITSIENHTAPRDGNSVFLPAKEVLSLHQVILKSREEDKVFGFDDTYLDLARALRRSPTGGKNYAEFAESRQQLEAMLGGRVQFDEASGRWLFRNGHARFPISVTAEGIKKIAILDTLLGNRYLDRASVVCIDEPEAALHPEAISTFLDILAALAAGGMQFFLASHSYFVVKKLCLIARQRSMSVPVLCADGAGWHRHDLREGMPENAIIAESIRLYKEEVGLALR